MVRAWIIFSSLILGVVFRSWKFDETNRINFPFSHRTLDTHSWVYFCMEHIIALAYALCIINPKWLLDATPTWLIWLFFAILCLDLIHFVLFFRDEGVGFNLVKAMLFGLPLIYTETKRNWTHLKKYINQG